MRNDEWRRVEELLSDALELEPAARRKFLDTAHDLSPELRREVESLLACEREADGFLDASALALSADLFDDGGAPEERGGQYLRKH